MSVITIDLTDEQVDQLQAVAARLQVTPEELVRASVGELLSRPAEDFARAAEYVLRKNRELYRRLMLCAI